MSIQVLTDGLFSFTDPPFTGGTPYLYKSTNNATYTVAPFWSDIDTTQLGEVTYRVITTATSANTVEEVSAFISRNMSTTFSGTWMIVAEWHEVPMHNTETNMVSMWPVFCYIDHVTTVSFEEN